MDENNYLDIYKDYVVSFYLCQFLQNELIEYSICMKNGICEFSVIKKNKNLEDISRYKRELSDDIGHYLLSLVGDLKLKIISSNEIFVDYELGITCTLGSRQVFEINQRWVSYSDEIRKMVEKTNPESLTYILLAEFIINLANT